MRNIDAILPKLNVIMIASGQISFILVSLSQQIGEIDQNNWTRFEKCKIIIYAKKSSKLCI